MMQSIRLDSSDDDSDWQRIGYDEPATPSSDDPRPLPSLARESSDGDSEEEAEAHAHDELVPRTKPGGYDSRIEQMLYENPELPILITDAGKSQESGGRYIVYTIKTAVRSVPSPSSSGILLTAHRNSLSVGATPSLPRYGMLSLVSIQPSSFLQYPRSTPWPTMRPTRQMRSKTSRSST